MGDRTYVNLYVPLTCKAETLRVIEYSTYQASDQTDNVHQACFGFEEVNYGELNFLRDLQVAGIPYDSCWQSGHEYPEGTQSLRFTPEGEPIVKEIYDTELNPPLQTLLELIDQPDALRAFILHHKEVVTALPWDNQAEYGKIYRARQLITPPEFA